MEYISGQCNIGEDEINQRRQSGYFSLFIAIAFGIYILIFKVPAWLRLVEFLPAFGAAIGIIQANQRFCAMFGILREQNFGPLGTTQRILEDEYARKDLMKALTIIWKSALIAAGVTVVFVLLSVIGV